MLDAENLTLQALAQSPSLVKLLRQRVEIGAADISALSPAFQMILSPNSEVDFVTLQTDSNIEKNAERNTASSFHASNSENTSDEEDSDSDNGNAVDNKIVRIFVNENNPDAVTQAFQDYLDMFVDSQLHMHEGVRTLLNLRPGIELFQAQAWYLNMSATYGGQPLTADEVVTVMKQGDKDVQAVSRMVLDAKNDPDATPEALKEADAFLLLHKRAMLDGVIQIQNDLLRREMLIIQNPANLPNRTPIPIGSVVMTEQRALGIAGVHDVSALTEARVQQVMRAVRKYSMTQEEVSALDRMFNGSQGLLARANTLRQVREDSLNLGID